MKHRISTRPLVSGLLARISITALAGALTFAVAPEAHGQYSLLQPFDSGTALGTTIVTDGTYLYGTKSAGIGVPNTDIFRIGADGSGFTTIATATGSGVAGAGADMGIAISGSVLYGTTLSGPPTGEFDTFGTVFRVNTNGTGLAVLRQHDNFNASFAHGAPVVVGGTVYGVTGGPSPTVGGIFKINTDGTGYGSVHDFTEPSVIEGNAPYAPLATDGTTLYGMTPYGGANNLGTIFKVETDGTGFQVLHAFAAGEGFFPQHALTIVGDTLFGATQALSPASPASIFKLDTDGSDFSLLHSFGPEVFALTSLTLHDGLLYGVTAGSAPADAQMLFAIAPDGTDFDVLETFDPGFRKSSIAVIDDALYGINSEGLYRYDVSAVPEPATAAWGLAALAGLALRRPRRTSSRMA